MAFTSISTSGAKVRASDLAAFFGERTPITAAKASDTSRASTTTRTADPDLSLTLTAGVWEIDGLLVVNSTSDAAGDFSFLWTYPSDAIMTGGAVGLATTFASSITAPDIAAPASSLDTVSPTTNYDFGAGTSPTIINARARITIVTTGAVTISWAQQSSNIATTTIKGGSAITARMVG